MYYNISLILTQFNTMKKEILITGAAGFLGSHLCDFFLNKSFSVTGIDNFSTGVKKNLAHLKKNKDFQFHEIDITQDFVLNKKFDYILHFASPASPIDYLKMPIETLRVGSVGTEKILNIARECNARILLASTSEVYGDPLVHPQNENYYGNVNPVGPRGVYDEAKRYLEALSNAYKNFFGLEIRIARIFNTYGPRMRSNDGRAIPSFLTQLINNKPFTVFGDGKQTRSFCYIDDTILAIYKLLISDYEFPVNIGNPNEISLLDLINNIKKLKNHSGKIIFSELPKNDPLKRKPDITLAKKILNWNPKINLEQGLKITYSYYKNNIFSQ